MIQHWAKLILDTITIEIDAIAAPIIKEGP
jgi:hypothetical protein